MHHKIVPILIGLIGLAFLLADFGVLTAGFVAVSWPVLLVLIALAKLMSRSCKCCSHG